jgi:tripartite-type tricarboxylate transporter receptor subunit TctC
MDVPRRSDVRIRTILLAWIITLLATSNLTLAAPYPERYLTLIVPVTAGGAGDFMGRLIADRLSNALGEKVIVDNRGGASGTIAAAAVARAAPDGYTLLLSSSTTHGTAPAAFKAIPYDPIKDFTHVGLIATAPAVLSINAALPPKSLAELVDYARRNQDQLNYGSSGVGSPGQFWAEMFKAASKVPMVHVPYKGTGPAMVDLASGQIQVILDGLPSQLSNLQAGTIRPLATMTVARSPKLPDVPTMAEAGYPTVLGGLWFGLSGPAGLPNDVVDRLSAELAKINADPTFLDRLQSFGIISTPLRNDEYVKFIRDEISRYGRIAVETNISIN